MTEQNELSAKDEQIKELLQKLEGMVPREDLEAMVAEVKRQDFELACLRKQIKDVMAEVGVLVVRSSRVIPRKLLERYVGHLEAAAHACPDNSP